jgi:ribosomal protein S18 acetylase RimI-like enzyme
MEPAPGDAPSIVPASEDDLQAISALAGVIWRACYPGIITLAQIEYMLTRMYSLETLREEVRSRGIRYNRLLAGAELVGFSASGPEGVPGVFKLHKLYLHPGRHGRGLGSLLLRHCEKEVREMGGRHLVLHVNKRNTKAIAAYERNGFVRDAEVVTDIGEGFAMDDFVMTKNLE